MAFDIKSIDKKKAAFVTLAVGMGIMATVLVSAHIEQKSQERFKALAATLTNNVDAQKIQQQMEALARMNQEVAMRQQSVESRVEGMAQAQIQPAAPAPQAPAMIKTPPGKRSITINVEKLNAVGGMISPGDYVDVIANMNIPRDPKNPAETDPVSATLFQNTLVAAVSNNASPGFQAPPEMAVIPVTLALNPYEAGLIVFAQQHGTISLILRSPLETDAYTLPLASWESLKDHLQTIQGKEIKPKQEKAEEPKEEKTTIDIYRGGNK